MTAAYTLLTAALRMWIDHLLDMSDGTETSGLNYLSITTETREL
jgi:hypothetical protein